MFWEEHGLQLKMKRYPKNAIKQKRVVRIENAVTIRASCHPESSKAWWIGAILKTRFPVSLVRGDLKYDREYFDDIDSTNQENNQR